MDQDIKKEFEKLHKEIKALTATVGKVTWVGPSWITSITGWDNEKLRQARQQKIVECKRSEGGGWLYKLESVPEQFIIKKQAS